MPLAVGGHVSLRTQLTEHMFQCQYICSYVNGGIHGPREQFPETCHCFSRYPFICHTIIILTIYTYVYTDLTCNEYTGTLYIPGLTIQLPHVYTQHTVVSFNVHVYSV